LVTSEIAEFFTDNEINLIISLDGPKELHDANRVFADGTGSFAKTRSGIEKLWFEPIQLVRTLINYVSIL